MAPTAYRRLREQTGMTAGAFGALLQLEHGVSNWYRIERGETQPTTRTLIPIATELANRLPGNRTPLDIIGEILELKDQS